MILDSNHERLYTLLTQKYEKLYTLVDVLYQLHGGAKTFKILKLSIGC